MHDSTVLVAYERDLTRHAQALVIEAMVDGRIQLTTTTSLAVLTYEPDRYRGHTVDVVDLRPDAR